MTNWGTPARKEPAALPAAYHACWRRGSEMMDRLERRYALVLPAGLMQQINDLQGAPESKPAHRFTARDSP